MGESLWQTVALGSVSEEGGADPPLDPAFTSAAGDGGARGQVDGACVPGLCPGSRTLGR